MMRFAGFTEGPPMSIISSLIAGRESRGRPAPVKILPNRFSEAETRIGCPRKRTSSPVLMPRDPVKT